MSFADVLWLFFMFSALQPVLHQRMLDAMRTRKIAQLEQERNSRVILLVHRQETMRFLGFPVVRYIDVNDLENVLRAIQMTDDDVPLDIVLHTPGGLSWRRSKSHAQFAIINRRSRSSCRTMRCPAAPSFPWRPTRSSCAGTPFSAPSIRNSATRRPRRCSRFWNRSRWPRSMTRP